MSVQLDGSASTSGDELQELAYNWSTNCPNGSISDSESAAPVLTFNPLTSDNMPVSCMVFLTVFNAQEESSACSSVVSVGNCNFDCLGQLNGTANFDRCGVCRGDGTSCLGCETVDISSLQFSIDGNQRAQARLVDQIARKILKNPNASNKSKRLAKKLSRESFVDFEDSWQLLWNMPQISTSCSNSQFCIQSDNSQVIDEIVANSAGLHEKLVRIVNELRLLTGKSNTAKNTLKQGARFDRQNVEAAGKIPVTVSACSQ